MKLVFDIECTSRGELDSAVWRLTMVEAERVSKQLVGLVGDGCVSLSVADGRRIDIAVGSASTTAGLRRQLIAVEKTEKASFENVCAMISEGMCARVCNDTGLYMSEEEWSGRYVLDLYLSSDACAGLASMLISVDVGDELLFERSEKSIAISILVCGE